MRTPIKIIHKYQDIRKSYQSFKFSRMNSEYYSEELKKIYKRMTGFELHLDSPRRFTEKIQWRKLYAIEPVYSTLADKYAVRAWVEERVGARYLIPCYGVWNDFDEINFQELPDKFVLKTTNGCATNIIVHDKNNLDLTKLRKKVNSWMRQKFEFANGFEMQYATIKPRIIIEKLIEAADELPDYKFICFNGKIYCMYVIGGRSGGHEEIKMGILDREFNLMPYTRKGLLMMAEPPHKPKNFEEMVAIVEKLAEGFDHVRVDLYNVEGTIYFGEMTFTSGGGFGMYDPDEFDYVLGNMWELKE